MNSTGISMTDSAMVPQVELANRFR
jgi:hypothetical protein